MERSWLGRITKPVSYARLRQDIFGLGRIFLDLLPKHHDIGPQVLEFVGIFGTPDGTQELDARLRSAGVSHQVG